MTLRERLDRGLRVRAKDGDGALCEVTSLAEGIARVEYADGSTRSVDIWDLVVL